jgi:hypothetical protein
MAGAAYPSDVAVGGRGEDVNRRVRAIRYIVELRQWVEITGIVGLLHAADVVVLAWGTAIVLKNLLPELANEGPAAIALIDKFRLGRAKCCFAWMFPPKIIHPRTALPRGPAVINTTGLTNLFASPAYFPRSPTSEHTSHHIWRPTPDPGQVRRTSCAEIHLPAPAPELWDASAGTIVAPQTASDCRVRALLQIVFS